jgi:hypothetical protein
MGPAGPEQKIAKTTPCKVGWAGLVWSADSRFRPAGRVSPQFTGAKPQVLAAKPFVNAANCVPISWLDEENEKGTLFLVRSSHRGSKETGHVEDFRRGSCGIGVDYAVRGNDRGLGAGHSPTLMPWAGTGRCGEKQDGCAASPVPRGLGGLQASPSLKRVVLKVRRSSHP